jgi:carbon-monoxide dehydrogenase small subunit/xanthine dehydrogenase small subunit
MNGRAVCSCLIPACQTDGAEVTTIEGLERDGELDRIQRAFIDNDATQCGFCTPGMIMASKALLMNNPSPSMKEIKEAISGNICRCTGYGPILKAVESLIDASSADIKDICGDKSSSCAPHVVCDVAARQAGDIWNRYDSHIVLRPGSLDELSACLNSPRAGIIVAGMTDLFAGGRKKLSNAETLIDVTHVLEMRGILLDESLGTLRIGAAETFGRIAANSAIFLYAGALMDAASSIGSPQIRNRATLGGNIANASPAADSLPALACLGAEFVVMNSSGVLYESDVVQLMEDTRRCLIGSEECIVEIRIPLRAGRVSVFEKLGSRDFVSISRINAAMAARYVNDDMVGLEIWVGTLGHAPRRIIMDKFDINSIKHALANLVDESISGRYSQVYKRTAIQGLAESLLKKLSDRAKVLK